jgi:deazaflavin-dependent oxidoreductase (nitroreductase family)
MTTAEPTHHRQPGWFTRRVMNPLALQLARRGVSVWGSRELQVRGRKSGELRSTVVNLMTHEGADYLLAPRGQTQWVRNLRVAGEGTLRVGRHLRPFSAVEVADDDKVDLLRAYLRRWKFEVGIFFDGVDAESTDEELRAIAPKHPAFAVSYRPGQGD